MNKIAFGILIIFLSLRGFGQTKSADLFDKINDFLITHVDAGKINYAAVKADPTKLNEIIAQIAVHDLSKKDESYKKAFYLNAYNLTVIKQVVDNYPIKSPFDVEGFFKQNKFKIAGESLTLDQLEFQRLMDPYKDSRIHFGLGCATMSCPSLYDNAFPA